MCGTIGALAGSIAHASSQPRESSTFEIKGSNYRHHRSPHSRPGNTSPERRSLRRSGLISTKVRLIGNARLFYDPGAAERLAHLDIAHIHRWSKYCIGGIVKATLISTSALALIMAAAIPTAVSAQTASTTNATLPRAVVDKSVAGPVMQKGDVDTKERAVRYVMTAPAQIVTPYRA